LSSSTPVKGSLAAAGMGRHAFGAAANAAGGAEVGGGVQCDASVLRGLHDLSGTRQAVSEACIPDHAVVQSRNLQQTCQVLVVVVDTCNS
jgi:hypothetical protein